MKNKYIVPEMNIQEFLAEDTMLTGPSFGTENNIDLEPDGHDEIGIL